MNLSRSYIIKNILSIRNLKLKFNILNKIFNDCRTYKENSDINKLVLI